MRVISVAAITLALALMSSLPVSAGMLPETYRGARAQAMGNAFVGLADDEQALFYNPAGLAGNQHYTFHYAGIDLAASQDLIGSISSAKEFSSPSRDTLNALMGKNISGQARLSSILLIPNFGIGFISDGQGAIYQKNKAWPYTVLGYQTTSGLQAGYGFSTGGKKGNRNRLRPEIRFGIAAKMLYRKGGYRKVPLTTIVSADTEEFKEMIGTTGRGFGVDLGTQYIRPVSKDLKLGFGLALTDVGGTSFGDGPDPIPQNLSAGLAATYEFGFATLNVAYDWRHILDETDWRKKSHLGFEFAIPMISVYAGLSQVNVTYGLAFDAWLFRVTAYSYTEELGSYAKQDSERRFALRMALKFDFL